VLRPRRPAVAPGERRQPQDQEPGGAEAVQYDRGVLRGHHVRLCRGLAGHRGGPPMGTPTMMRRSVIGIAAAVGLALPLPAFAQASAEEPAGKDDAIKSILDRELEPAPGGYTYNPQGRRDPFVSLIKPVGADT